MKNKKILIFLIFGLVIMAVMLYFIGIDKVWAALKLSNLWFVLLAIILQVFTYYLYTLRWHIINKTIDISLGIKKLLPIVLVSLAINNLTPSGRGGGEPVRAYILSKESNYQFEETFATVIADRALDTLPFVALAILTIVAIIFTFSLSWTWIVLLSLCVVGISIVVIVLIYICVNVSFGVKITNLIVKFARRFYKKYDDNTEKNICNAVAEFQSNMNSLIREKDILYYALPLSFIIWFFEILRVYVVFLAFGASVNPVIIGEVFILASLVGMIPLLPGGLGAIDGIMILLYSRAGITASICAAATVIERLISFWMTTFLGMIILPMYGSSVLNKSLDELSGSEEQLSESTPDENFDDNYGSDNNLKDDLENNVCCDGHELNIHEENCELDNDSNLANKDKIVDDKN